LIREIQFLVPVTVTLTSERRRRPPYGLQGGWPGVVGKNSLIRDNKETLLPGKASLSLEAGDRLRIETPGGGGHGRQQEE
jgi:N-methylhydantoinase B/oxoprolinase/acetone carboxylase alpha subunit